MKKYVFYIFIWSLLLCSGCYDDDIITSKPGEPIDPVSNLAANAEGDQVNLSWDLPSAYPENVIEPVSVLIHVSVDGRREGGSITLEDNAVSYTYSPYDPAKTYRFTVKVMAHAEPSEDYQSGLFYSPGSTIEL
ncbi:DUF4945 domain-containing protein [Sinomicrobium weinanense]|uniref:DUF4945 domain-containing protein n=1 Tax=Sinomicrobium weinanense TaxID=2842200 RepID=A0A926JQP4_9FLAO|nr:DUF4945 domain-containing protein [Sinomicrobium weinanense]MBC9795720.1 DUF4945 domain-containing protein [Sinomicrobium weinanense]MBU3125283.1 DUF4945 domain-containing protein [Sinomicrobium weinanense]